MNNEPQSKVSYLTKLCTSLTKAKKGSFSFADTKDTFRANEEINKCLQ